MNDIMFTLARTRKRLTHSQLTHHKSALKTLTAIGTEQTNRADADVSIAIYRYPTVHRRKKCAKKGQIFLFFGWAVFILDRVLNLN